MKTYCVKKDVDSKWSKLIGRLQEGGKGLMRDA